MTLARAAKRRSTMLVLKANVSKAYRRGRVLGSDRHWQPCRTRSAPPWANTVGAVGIGSSGYWWGRLGGSVGRIIWSLLGQCDLWLFCRLLWLWAGGTDAVANIALSLWLLGI
eukprot:9327518-Karenia_brevis.AAC.1